MNRFLPKSPLKSLLISVFALTALATQTALLASPTQTAFAASYFESEKDIISREEWGADESYLFLENNDSEPDLIELDENFAETYADELEISRTVTHDSLGRAFKWPPEYPEQVTKFIIHHTETTSNLDNPKQAIRDIYHYHSFTRGWGDIGYNYIIDQQGRVYEGRYGGEGVVGGHAGPGNIGSIGIAILGSYDENGEEVPQAAINSLAKLISIKSKIHNINPEGYGTFRGSIRANVMGHRDIMDTTCPGNNLYDIIPMIASMAKSINDEDKPKFVKDYDFIDKSSTYYLEMEPQETKTVTIKFENIGKKTWNSETFLVVNKNLDNEQIVEFPERSGVKLAMMKEKSVAPGKTGTFTFKIKSKTKSNLVFLDLTLVVNEGKKLSDYKVLPVKVNMPIYTYDLISYDKLPSTMQKGEKFEGLVKLKNTGNITWTRIGKNKAYLRIGNKPVGFLQEGKVAKGETGTFKVVYEAPGEYGAYSEQLHVILKGGGELNGDDIKYSTLISKTGYAGDLIRQTTLNQFEKGATYTLWARIQNIGSETWDTKNITLGYIKDNDITVTNKSFTKKQVKPGETIEIDVVIKVSKNATLKTDRPFVIIPKINGKRFVQKRISIHYDIVSVQPSEADKSEVYAYDAEHVNVTDQELSQDKGGNVRVRISFYDHPVVTSNKEFYLYNSKGEKLKTIKAGEEATLENSSSYKAKAKEDAYLEIKNFDRTSSWDSSYNDNKFRGTLEFQIIDGEYTVINELPLEDYLKGLAEEPNSEPTEKIKAISIAARSYAKFYMHYAEKFPGKPYDLNDDPAICQKYLGYGYESRAPNVVKAVEDTEGEVVTYGGQLIKTPYFSSSDGKTKSALEVWDWNAPYLISVDDSYCQGAAQSGHGVGMSGCGAKGMAQNGYSYKEILKYYYTNTEVTKLW
ncbi:MAG: SpoIID/LytB domain-containing protein [Candidatus Gracilibacteria bacterium]